MKIIKPKRACSWPCRCFWASGGCATTAENPRDPVRGLQPRDVQVNEGIDKVVKPVAQGYDVAPPVKAGVGNFFGNPGMPGRRGSTTFLQGKGAVRPSDAGRVS